jgi:hypothetical protein
VAEKVVKPNSLKLKNQNGSEEAEACKLTVKTQAAQCARSLVARNGG